MKAHVIKQIQLEMPWHKTIQEERRPGRSPSPAFVRSYLIPLNFLSAQYQITRIIHEG